MHIITNGFKEVQFIKLQKSGLKDYFDIIVCSEDVGKNKPSPAIFHHSMSHAKAKPEDSVMIGDDFEVDILGALSVGMQGVLLIHTRNTAIFKTISSFNNWMNFLHCYLGY